MGAVLNKRFACKMFRLTTVLVLCLAAVALGKVRTSKRPGFMMGNPLYDPVWEDDSKIVGGEEVVPGSRPYQLSFQYDFGFHFCGAIAYTADYAITAAHCCEGQSAGDLRIVAGEHNLFEEDGQVKVNVLGLQVHESYGPFGFENDICLINHETVELGGNIMGVTMPSQGQDWDAGSNARVSGWGTLSSGGSSPDTLQAVNVPVVSDADCEDAYGSDMDGPTMICAGEEGKDSCQGDSGGPMTCGEDDMDPLCGIVSWGRGCALAGYPGVYTQASTYVDWCMENSY